MCFFFTIYFLQILCNSSFVYEPAFYVMKRALQVKFIIIIAIIMKCIKKFLLITVTYINVNMNFSDSDEF